MAKKAATKKKVTGERVEFWKNKKGEFNFRIYNRTGRIIGGSVGQGFKRRAGVYNSLAAMDAFFHGGFDTKKIIEVSK